MLYHTLLDAQSDIHYIIKACDAFACRRVQSVQVSHCIARRLHYKCRFDSHLHLQKRMVDPGQLATLMSLTRLSCQCFHCCAEDRGKYGEGDSSLPRTHLGDFIADIGSVLGTVTELTLNLTSSWGEEQGQEHSIHELVLRTAALSEELSLLATACPALQKLCVYGMIHKDVVQAFGLACPNLTHLDLGPHSLQKHILQQLNDLLPHVCHLAFHAAIQPCIGAGKYQKSVLSGVYHISKACTSITHLNLGQECAVHSSTWVLLPSSLKVLLSSAKKLNSGPAKGVILPNLEHVEWQSDLQGVCNLLLASPKLRYLKDVIDVHCKPCMLHRWGVLCKRVDAGLRGIASVHLSNNCAHGNFGAFLELAQPLSNVKHVGFACVNHNIDEQDVDCLQDISRVFPHVDHLTFGELGISDKSLHDLLSCRLLGYIHMYGCDRVTVVGAGMMAASLVSLQLLRFTNCSEFGDENAQHLIGLLERYAPRVQVIAS